MIGVRQMTVGLAVAGVLAASLAFAQGPGGGRFGRGPGPGPGGGPGRLGGPALFGLAGPGFNLGRLNLTDAQRQQMRDIRERNREAVQALRTKMREAATAEREAIQALPVDEGRIRAASQALANISADVAVQSARIRSEMWAALTPEQQAEVTKRQTEIRNRIRDRAERFRERRAERQAR
jgi:protein CpxP